MKITGRTDPNKTILIRKLISYSSQNEAAIWKKVAESLSRPNRNRVEVNVSNLNRNTSAGETIVVPGKVLGTGDINHKLLVAAESFSSQSKNKIESAGGTCLTIEQLLEKNPKGSKIRLFE